MGSKKTRPAKFNICIFWHFDERDMRAASFQIEQFQLLWACWVKTTFWWLNHSYPRYPLDPNMILLRLAKAPNMGKQIVALQATMERPSQRWVEQSEWSSCSTRKGTTLYM
jgi:hypothetical protein